jgi:outer membrane receptor protein involved in Fe transport
MELAHTTNVEEYLRKVPQFAAAEGRNVNNGQEGASTIDLRNLGEERTLVLMDGKRFTPYDSQGFVDLGMIPGALVERVEVITGGASAVYGADAIGGVVNFIMKKDFEGVELDSSYGITEEGDGDVFDMSVTMGGNIDGGRGNVVFNASYTNQAKVSQGERPFGVDALDDLLEPVGSGTTPDGTVNYGTFRTQNNPAITAINPDPDFPDYLDSLDGFAQFEPNSDIRPFDEPFNFNPFNLYQVPQKKWSSTVIGRYELTDEVEFFARGSFANNRVDAIIAPSGTFFEEFEIDYGANAYLDTTAQQVFEAIDIHEPGCVFINPNDPDDPGNGLPLANPPANCGDGLVTVGLGRRLVEVGARTSQYENTAYQFVGGLRGEVFESQNWEVFGQYGRTSRSQNFLNDTTITKAQQALTAVDDGSGNIVCADSSGGCSPINIFGGPITAEGAAFINTALVEVNKTSQLIYGGTFGGDIPLTIPSADTELAYVLGFERREEDSQHRPDDNYKTGNAIGFGASTDILAEIEVTEYFGELRVPIVEGVSFLESVILETGIRYSDYKNSATVGADTSRNDFEETTFKFGGEWAPGGGLRLRGMFQRATRSPSLYEIGLPRTPSTGDLSNDPCDNNNAPTDPDLIQLCLDTGVPPGQVGQFVSIISGQINNFLAGNPTLQPEDADTTTFGFVWTPDFIEGLELSIDYYEIEIDQAIREVTEQNIVDACYEPSRNPTGDPNNEFCQLIFRNSSTGALIGPKDVGVDRTRRNGGVLQVEGIDFQAAYGFDIGAGTLDLGLVGVYILGNDQQDAIDAPLFSCEGLGGATCVRPSPELTFLQTTQWTQGPVSVQLIWQFIDEVTQDSVAFGSRDASEFAVVTIDSQNYFDLAGTYEINDTWSVRAGIQNLLDEDPPIPGNDWGGTQEVSGNTYPSVYDPLGRKYWFGVKAAF